MGGPMDEIQHELRWRFHRRVVAVPLTQTGTGARQYRGFLTLQRRVRTTARREQADPCHQQGGDEPPRPAVGHGLVLVGGCVVGGMAGLVAWSSTNGHVPLGRSSGTAAGRIAYAFDPFGTMP